jgi:alkanesulfonate monooxygenase SsuD/methylene tetrahydromethanopterin reductase-like flavin-dependent oxidoreductase (luciferase family)
MPNQTAIVPFWKGYDRKLVVRAAQLAEDLGYDSIWVPEGWAYEQFQLLTEIAIHTKRIKLATGIANIFSRSAALLAMSSATLDEISEGRFILGLGTSGKNVVENLHGVRYEKPLTRMKETVAIVKTLLGGGRLTPEMSKLFDLRHFKLEMQPFRPAVPIYIASLQEKAIRDVGRIADGWVPTFWPWRHLRDGIALLAEGARDVGRSIDEIEIAPFTAVIPLPDLEMARSFIRPTVSFYIGGMGVYYHALFCKYGFKDNADLVRDLYAQGKRKEAAAALSPDLLDAISICGAPEHCRERLAEWRGAGVGTAILNLPSLTDYGLVEHFLRAMAPNA